jgi:excinuclease ABC subunit C
MKAFDQKFGPEKLTEIPAEPGVYRYFDAADRLIYVGKAKNLRRRLAQYRNAKRRKAHMKMKSIIRDAVRIEFETCASELEACLLETRLIQQHRPRLNVAGAFSFMYPMIGVKIDGPTACFCYTTQPESFPDYRFHGAFRSRKITREAFFALVDLMSFIGHPMKKGAGKRVRYSHVVAFRQLPASWVADLDSFWRGESQAAMEELVLALVERPAARKKRDKVQDMFDAIKRFWREEARPLAEARAHCGFAVYPVPQMERDVIFLKLRHAHAEA